MAHLIIKRKKELVNSMRDIELFVDQTLIGTISNGKTEVFDLKPGTYKLKAEIDWCGSRVQAVEIKDGESRIIELSAYKYSNFLLPALLLAGLLGVVLDNLFQPDLSFLAWIILVPGFLYMLYYISFGKNEYLRLKSLE